MDRIQTHKLGFWAALSLVIGNIIGIGIFTTTGYMTEFIQSPLLILIAWCVGAFYALSGAKVYSVLAQAYPLSGGDYQYLRKSVHPLAGYLFGWSAFFVTYTGSIAALGIGAAYYFQGIFGWSFFDTSIFTIGFGWLNIDLTYLKIWSIIFILFFSWINFRGIKLSANYQITLAVAIVILIIVFIAGGFISEKSSVQFLATPPVNNQNISDFFTSLIAVLFTYMGWTTIVYIAEEIEDAGKIIPKALISGVLLVSVLYMLINYVYLISLPVSEMKGVVNIATVTAERLWGRGSSVVISLVIFIAVLSSLNSTILSGPRIYMAMGRDKYFHSFTAKINQRFNTPANAILIQAIWSVLLVLSGTFNQLLTFVISVVTAFSVLAGGIAFKIYLHTSAKNIVTFMAIIFYTIFCLIILINTIISQPMQSFIGLAIVLVAVPVYFWETGRTKSN